MKTTKIIENKIKENDNISFDHENYTLPHLLINDLFEQKNIVRQDVINELLLDTHNAYKYFNGSRTIKRDLFLKLLVYLKCNIDDVQLYLKKCGYKQLYVRHERDFIIYQGIAKNKTVCEIDNDLFNKKLVKL